MLHYVFSTQCMLTAPALNAFTREETAVVGVGLASTAIAWVWSAAQRRYNEVPAAPCAMSSESHAATEVDPLNGGKDRILSSIEAAR